MEEESKKHKSRREVDGEKREDSRREKGRDRDRDSERKERKSEKDRGSEDKYREGKRAERERSVDEKHRDSRRSERERNVDEKHRDSRRSERERSVDEKHRDSRRSERERSVDGKHREKDRESRLKEKEKEKSRDRERDKEKEEKEREKKRERARERAEREKERERAREEREQEERDRDREERERERRRREYDRDEEEDGRDRDRKRRKQDDSHDRERERSSRSERQNREGSEEDRKRRTEEESESKDSKPQEEDPEEEQRKLDEEMEKRRRRVQEWQELRRKKEEQERENTANGNGEENVESGKKWTLEGESDDEEATPDENMGNIENSKAEGTGDGVMEVDSDNSKATLNGNVIANDEEEIDPLDAFMNALEMPPDVEEMDTDGISLKSDSKKAISDGKSSAVLVNGDALKNGRKPVMGRIIPGEDSDLEYDDHENDDAVPEDEDDEEFMKRVKKTKVEKLTIVDHSKIQYPPFRKNFYIEVKEIARMIAEEVACYRKQFELKIHGKDVPKPVKTWNQTGLTSKVLDTIKKLNFEKPMPIQAQALPIIMSGRDCIGVAKTGSGKTLAFVLPMLRHIKDQPPVVAGDGPIGLIMAPTRELVQQIHSDIKKFSKVVGITCVPVYGGSGVAQQISDLKRGAEIVVCTPGRMIDILCTSSGKITNLRRVTYLVMDEADRMFDMGFEPQITRIVQNTRPDRQTVLFSATFPRQVEILARKVLNKPVEIQVGGRSVVNKDITQLVEVRQESD